MATPSEINAATGIAARRSRVEGKSGSGAGAGGSVRVLRDGGVLVKDLLKLLVAQLGDELAAQQPFAVRAGVDAGDADDDHDGRAVAALAQADAQDVLRLE